MDVGKYITSKRTKQIENRTHKLCNLFEYISNTDKFSHKVQNILV